MTLKLLSIFCTVYKEGSITRAAQKLNMAQPAVSLAIKELEQYYETALFERRNRRIYPTKASDLLLQYANTILAQEREALHALRDEKSISTCRIGVNVSVGESFLEPLLRFLQAQHPEIKLTTLVLNTRQIELKAIENEVDFSITDIVASGRDFVSVSLGSELMLPVSCPTLAAATPRLSPKEFLSQNLLLRENGSGTRECINAAFATFGYAVTPVLESSSTYCLSACAKSGQGITILPQSMIADELASGTLVPIQTRALSFERRYYMIYHKNKYLVMQLKEVMDSVATFFREQL